MERRQERRRRRLLKRLERKARTKSGAGDSYQSHNRIKERKARLTQRLRLGLGGAAGPNVYVIAYEGLTSLALQNLRKELRATSDGLFLCGSNEMMRKVIKQWIKEKDDERWLALLSVIQDKVALLFTSLSYGQVHQILLRHQSYKFPKVGSRAFADIILVASPPCLSAQWLSDLIDFGIKTRVFRGSVAIMEDGTLVHKGELITEKHLRLLKVLEYQPIVVHAVIKTCILAGEWVPSDFHNVYEKALSADKEIAEEQHVLRKMYETVFDMASLAYITSSPMPLANTLFSRIAKEPCLDSPDDASLPQIILPEELLYTIWTYLIDSTTPLNSECVRNKVRDLLAVSTVCKQWRLDIHLSGWMWKRIYYTCWPFQSRTLAVRNWQKLFLSRWRTCMSTKPSPNNDIQIEDCAEEECPVFWISDKLQSYGDDIRFCKQCRKFVPLVTSLSFLRKLPTTSAGPVAYRKEEKKLEGDQVEEASDEEVVDLFADLDQ